MPPCPPASGSAKPDRDADPAASLCPDDGSQAAGGDRAPDRIATLTNRRDFVAAARARRINKPGFILQYRQRHDTEPAASPVRVGFTCSKKVGNAVRRNRAKRRLRAIVRDVLPHRGRAGFDYVLIGRADVTATLPYADLVRQLKQALSQAHGSGK